VLLLSELIQYALVVNKVLLGWLSIVATIIVIIDHHNAEGKLQGYNKPLNTFLHMPTI